jgi:hypothetical protein
MLLTFRGIKYKINILYVLEYKLMFFGVNRMKLNKIMAFFCIGLPICVSLRIFQIIFTIEFETGFYLNEFKTLGKLILAAILVFCAFLWLYSSRYYKSLEKPPEYNMLLSITAVGLAVVTVAQAFMENTYLFTFSWQSSLIKIVGVITALYFLLYAAKYYINFKFPSLLHIIPCVFMILRTAFIFINTSAIAHISDNVLILASYCAVMVFFVNFAKLYNNIDIEKNFKKLLSSGLVSAVLCFTQSIGHFIINFASGDKYLHVSHVANISVFFMGIFVIVFIITHFCMNKEN